MKCIVLAEHRAIAKSRPTRGAWIEMPFVLQTFYDLHSRAPHGARGLKYFFGIPSLVFSGRAPHGARGLKSTPFKICLILASSRPTRGAWIEIASIRAACMPIACRAPHGARGLKYCWRSRSCPTAESRPTRGAWIEICWALGTMTRTPTVAPHTGRVD